jgi:hypothetical protein
MKKKILAGFASFTLATALVIAPSIVGGGNNNVLSANAATFNRSCFVAAFDSVLNNTCSPIRHIQIATVGGKGSGTEATTTGPLAGKNEWSRPSGGKVSGQIKYGGRLESNKSLLLWKTSTQKPV